jgi:hypothetical protein
MLLDQPQLASQRAGMDKAAIQRTVYGFVSTGHYTVIRQHSHSG